MKTLTDQILNKYLDGELSASELEELKNIIENDEDEMNKLRAIKFVDKTLSEMVHSPAPASISRNILNMILKPSSKNEGNFFKYIIGGFLFLLTLIIGFTVFSLSAVENTSRNSFKIFGFDLPKLNVDLTPILTYLGSDLFLVTGSALTMILLLLIYFITDSHKTYKRDINSLQH